MSTLLLPLCSRKKLCSHVWAPPVFVRHSQWHRRPRLWAPRRKAEVAAEAPRCERRAGALCAEVVVPEDDPGACGGQNCPGVPRYIPLLHSPWTNERNRPDVHTPLPSIYPLESRLETTKAKGYEQGGCTFSLRNWMSQVAAWLLR